MPAYLVPALYLGAIICIFLHYLMLGKSAKVGELAKSIGLLTGSDIQLILGSQKNVNLKFGEIAIENDLLTAREVSLLLEIQAT